MSGLPSGILAISVDLESDPLRPTERRPSRDDFSGRLLALLEKYRTPATWGVATPNASVTSRIMQGLAGHELAILGDASWVGPHAGRTRFSRELHHRLSLASACGHEISALMLRGGEIGDHSDVLVRQGIIVIGNAASRPAHWSGRRLEKRSEAIRYGLWQIPVSRRLCPASDWMWATGIKVRRGIDRAARSKAIYHLAIDAAALSVRAATGLALVERVLRHAARRCDQGLLRTTTLSGAAALLMGGQRSTPARSILHPAA